MFWKGGDFPLQLCNLQIQRLQAGDLLHIRGHLIIYSSIPMPHEPRAWALAKNPPVILGRGKMPLSGKHGRRYETQPRKRSKETGRLETFSNAVFIIAITLLAA